MFERPGSGSQAVLVSLDFGDPDFAESTEELVQLATSAKVSVVDIIKGKRLPGRRPHHPRLDAPGLGEAIVEAHRDGGVVLKVALEDLPVRRPARVLAHAERRGRGQDARLAARRIHEETPHHFA